MSKENTTTHYNSYLTSIHERNTTPDEILNNVIEESLGAIPLSKERIIAGEANEVYDIVLPDQSHIILRISRNEHPDFLQEEWAINECKKLNVPAPEIIAIKHQIINETQLSFCLQRKLNGDPLERGKIDYHTLDKKFLEHIIGQAGEILSKIHSISTKGFGGINGQGQGKVATFQHLLADKTSYIHEYEILAKKIELNPDIISPIISALAEVRLRYKDIKPILNHGDYGPKHIMIDGDKVSGILDFGEVSGHSPIHDFARWDYWFGDEIPISWLKAGYARKKLFNEQFDHLLSVIKLHIGLEVLWWYHEQNYPEGIRRAKRHLEQDWTEYQKIS